MQRLNDSLGFENVAMLCRTLDRHLHLVAAREQPCSFDVVFAACDYIAAHANALHRGAPSPSLPIAIESHLLALIGTHSAELAATNRFTQTGSNGLNMKNSRRPKSLGKTGLASQDRQAEVDRVTQRKYLVVDDDASMRRLISKVLEEFGRCSSANDGHEAIAAIEAAMRSGEPFDGVYLDINMPNMDGHRVLEHIRCIEHAHGRFGTSGSKIIVVTSEVDDRHAVRAYKAGCQLFLKKPLRVADLRRSFAALGILGHSNHPQSLTKMFMDDVRSVGVRDKRGGYQLAEVRWESLTEMSLLVDDVSRLRPEEALSLDYRHRSVPVVLRSIDPMNQDGRFCLMLELT